LGNELGDKAEVLTLGLLRHEIARELNACLKRYAAEERKAEPG